MDLLSEHGFRQDGRKPGQIRQQTCKLGVYKQADGSAYLEQGNTKVLAAVYGPHEMRYRSKMLDDKCYINCQYSMATFSTTERKLRPRGDRKSSEFTQHLVKTFEAAILTHVFPRSQIDIFCEILQADGSNLAACINAATLALVDAGIPMRGCVSACTCACVRTQDGVTPVIDVSHVEEGGQMARLTMALLPRNEQIVLLELDNRIHNDYVESAMDKAIEGCKMTHECMESAIRKHVSDYSSLA